LIFTINFYFNGINVLNFPFAVLVTPVLILLRVTLKYGIVNKVIDYICDVKLRE